MSPAPTTSTSTTHDDEVGLVEICADELWGGVYCTLPPGHAGSHESVPSSEGGCSLTWRAAVAPTPAAVRASSEQLESFLRMVRGAPVAHR
ncbi:MAG: hypothetical protein JWP01_1231 [Myxococcales bacterium]|nr:hypothetical protein [Myxococcales bacterium]